MASGRTVLAACEDLAAFLLGIAETVLTTYADIPLSRDGIAMLMLVVLILFRPQGLLGKA